LASKWEDLERSPAARLLAEKALLRLLIALRGHEIPIVVLGGLVPEVLARDQEPPAPQHLGTTDVDVHLGLSLQLDAAHDLGALEDALKEAHFSPDETTEGWRWQTRIEGARVKIEFLCELDDQPEEAIVTPVGCNRLTAVNLRGTRYVTEDFEWEELSGDLADGTRVTQRVRFAGLEGYLMSKVHVAWRRGLAKDYYDLVTRFCTTDSEVREKRPTRSPGGNSEIASTWQPVPGPRYVPDSLTPKTSAPKATRTKPSRPTRLRTMRRLGRTRSQRSLTFWSSLGSS
jgi:hypothetical protein